MSGLKPIGSEKLQGDEKIKRILEIARYKETPKNNVNETASIDYTTKLADGNVYHIVKEKLGYIIKQGLTEGTSDYIVPMKNRKYYQSYSDALKVLNLMAKEINQLEGINEGISLFTEQKKYYLKTPKPAAPPVEDVVDVPQPEEPQMPSEEPSLPEEPMDDMGPEEPMDDMGMEEPMDSGMEGMDMEDNQEPDGNEDVTFKTIQKLTGKLGQKIRAMEDNGVEISSKDAKYVINSILSALEDNLDEDDKLDIVSKLEGEGEDMGDSEVDMDMEDVEDIPSDEESIPTEEPTDGEMTEKFMSKVIDKVFSESSVDKVLSKYFMISESEKKFVENKKKIKKNIVEDKKKNNLKEVIRLSESLKQKNVAEKVINSFPEVTFVGKTNKGNLVFENKNKQLKVTPNGQIL